jgi:preprotein translocase subunit SecG
MESILLILEFVLTGLITVAVLLQKSSSIGLGAYGGSNETVFGAKGPAAFLAKITMFLSIVFVINTISLGYVYSNASTDSVMDAATINSAPVTQDAPMTPPAPPAIPTAK